MAFDNGILSFDNIGGMGAADENSADIPLPVLDFSSLDMPLAHPSEQLTALDIKLQAAGRVAGLVDHAVVVKEKELMTTQELKERLRGYHSHIFEGIDAHWGNPEFYLYIGSLLVEFERIDRQGFRWEVNAILRELEKRHEKEFPASHISLKPDAGLTVTFDQWDSVKRK